MYLGTQLVIPFRYKSIFRQGLWAATAFKGATSSCALIPNVSVHVSNHLGWQELLNKNQGFQVSNSFYTPLMTHNRLKSFLKVHNITFKHMTLFQMKVLGAYSRVKSWYSLSN